MRNAMLIVLVTALSAFFVGCKSSHQEGVTSNYHAQWLSVLANTEDATEAAREVLTEEGLKDVKASSTMVDGTASGRMADDTKVNVSIKKVGEKTSEVSVVVGTMGDPDLGAELAKKIKDKAESTP